MDIKLGQRVKDRVTNFEGIATGRCQYITGCDRILVQPPVKDDGTFVESRWVDDTRLTVVDETVVFAPEADDKNGPDAPAPRK